MSATQNGKSRRQTLAKTPTGIKGLDEITEGGLPRGAAPLWSPGARVVDGIRE